MVAATAVIVLAASAAVVTAMTVKEAVKARGDAMGSMSADMKAINAFIKDGKGTSATVADKAAAIASTAKQIPGLFPKGSGRGDLSDKETRALPAIWSNRAGFEKAAQHLVDEAGKLAEVAKGGDKTQLAAQFGAIGKGACGACHKAFRGAKVK